MGRILRLRVSMKVSISSGMTFLPGAAAILEIRENKAHISGENIISIKNIKDNHYLVSGLRGDSFLYRGRIHYKGKSSPFSRPIKVKLYFENGFALENNISEIINTSTSPTISWKKVSPDEKILIILSQTDQENSKRNTKRNYRKQFLEFGTA